MVGRSGGSFPVFNASNRLVRRFAPFLVVLDHRSAHDWVGLHPNSNERSITTIP
jgi:hypothetical protein